MAVLLPSIRARKPGATATSLIAFVAILAVLYFGRLFFVTLALGIGIAFILEPFVDLLIRIRLPRPVASFVVCSFAVLVLYVLGVGFYYQSLDLVDELPKYRDRIVEIVAAVQGRVESAEKSVAGFFVPGRGKEEPPPPVVQSPPPQPASPRSRRRAEPVEPQPVPPPAQEVRVVTPQPTLASVLFGRLHDLLIFLLMASFIPFLVYFMLSWKDHLYRSFMRLFESEERLIADRTWEGIASMVRSFVVGNFVIAVLLSIASSVAFWLFDLPYPMLIGPVSGLLSVIPYIGLPLALVPPFFVGLRIFPTVTGFVLVGSTVAVLHLLALNLLFPKIVGSRVHLNPMVVTLALMFWSVLWGEVGLLLAIPITAAVKAVCDNVTVLQPYGKLLGD
jgi:predicted PurR-regulated permease PerM